MVEVNISLVFHHWVGIALHFLPFVSDITIFVVYRNFAIFPGNFMVSSRCHRKNCISCVDCIKNLYLKYRLETSGNLLECCFHDLLDMLLTLSIYCSQ